MDLVTGGQGVEVLRLVEVPEHGRAVFAAGGTEGAVGGDGHGVDVTGVTDVVGLDAAIGKFPYLRQEEIVRNDINLLRVLAQLEDFLLLVVVVVISALVIGCLIARKL